MDQVENSATDLAENLPAAKAAARNTLTALSADGGGIVFQTVSEARDVAYLMASSDKAVRAHLRNNPGACFGIVIQAVEWGLSPYAVANKSYLVNDQIAYESQLIQAVILRRAPIRGRIRFNYEGDGQDRFCVASATDLSGDLVEYRSPKLKDIKPQNSPLWKNDPDQQLAYYSGRSLCRRHFPDVLLGIYDRDEMDGAEAIKDVTPKSSGLADRLNKVEPQGGFSAAGVAETLGEPAKSTAEPAKSDGEPSKSEAKTAQQAPSHDPEVARAGAQSFIDGDPREVPEDSTDADKAAWLYGWDQAKAGAEGGAS